MVSRPERDASIDLVRGAVMVLMALDHMRDFVGDHTRAPLDLATTTWPLFFTRWVTHFCAPVFVLLAGVSAWAAGRSMTPRASTSQLVTRGLWLVLLELTVVRFGWLFNVDYRFSFVQVIWAIGWSMVALALVSRAGPRASLAIGVAMIVGHNLFDGVHASSFGAMGWAWRVAHEGGALTPVEGHRLYVAYPLVPWIGVMAAGYGLGPWLALTVERRRTLLLRTGAALVGAFALLRAVNRYGDPTPWSTQPRAGFTLLSFLDCEKYPPSLAYLLMTLGPALLVWGALTGRDLARARRDHLRARAALLLRAPPPAAARARGRLGLCARWRRGRSRRSRIAARGGRFPRRGIWPLARRRLHALAPLPMVRARQGSPSWGMVDGVHLSAWSARDAHAPGTWPLATTRTRSSSSKTTS